MELAFKVKMNDKLFLRDPESSDLGKKIIRASLTMIREMGFEDFTFKKLAAGIGTAEASIYRYFENKHRLLTYIFNWYWSYLEAKVVFHVHNLTSAEERLKKIVRLVAVPEKETSPADFDEKEAFLVVMYEGSKAYHTRHVAADNKDRLFKAYKDLCNRIAGTITEFAPHYPYPHALASTVLEMSHAQRFFSRHLPSLTDFNTDKEESKLVAFLESLLFSTLKYTGGDQNA